MGGDGFDRAGLGHGIITGLGGGDGGADGRIVEAHDGQHRLIIHNTHKDAGTERAINHRHDLGDLHFLGRVAVHVHVALDFIKAHAIDRLGGGDIRLGSAGQMDTERLDRRLLGVSHFVG